MATMQAAIVNAVITTSSAYAANKRPPQPLLCAHAHDARHLPSPLAQRHVTRSFTTRHLSRGRALEPALHLGAVTGVVGVEGERSHELVVAAAVGASPPRLEQAPVLLLELERPRPIGSGDP
jgi:hypothetical protein